MGLGFDNALAEITLVVFTTLAPSGAVAFIVMGIPLLGKNIGERFRRELSRFLCIPVLVVLVGLVASATHLGTPSNALYVLAGVGRSPLSNEVFAAALFLGLAGSYWLHSFSRTRKPVLERVWLALSMVAAVGFVIAVAFAYQVDTIITWTHPSIPLNLVLNSLVGGPLAALVGFAAAELAGSGNADAETAAVGSPEAGVPARIGRICVVVSGAALVANIAGYAAQAAAVQPLANSAVSVAALAPHYGLAIAVMFALCATGVAVCALALRRLGCVPLRLAIVSALMALTGIFIMRFAFYMIHMTVGISF